ASVGTSPCWERVNNGTPSAFSRESMCRPTVGCVRPAARAAADSDPVRTTPRKDRYRLQSGVSVAIQIIIATRALQLILFYHARRHPALTGLIRHTQEHALMSQTKTALILGATGGIGGELVIALSRHGWRINALNRDPAKARRRNGTAPAVNW